VTSWYYYRKQTQIWVELCFLFGYNSVFEFRRSYNYVNCIFHLFGTAARDSSCGGMRRYKSINFVENWICVKKQYNLLWRCAKLKFCIDIQYWADNVKLKNTAPMEILIKTERTDTKNHRIHFLVFWETVFLFLVSFLVVFKFCFSWTNNGVTKSIISIQMWRNWTCQDFKTVNISQV